MKDLNLTKNLNKLNNKNIALIGHMGSGKTILGKLIAKKLKINHYDSDNLIETNTKKTINEIFKDDGEKEFRLIEEKIILNLTNKSEYVLSLGGGSIMSSKIRKRLKHNFITVFIDVNLDTLIKRLKQSTKRPLLLGTKIQKKIKELDIVRRKYYLMSDIILTNNKSVNKTLSIFLEKYQKIK